MFRKAEKYTRKYCSNKCRVCLRPRYVATFDAQHPPTHYVCRRKERGIKSFDSVCCGYPSWSAGEDSAGGGHGWANKKCCRVLNIY